jgi:chromosome segregation ATPase
MRSKTNVGVYILRTSILLFVITSSVACTALMNKDEQSSNSRLLAEYSMMKKRLPLVERENDVLKQENLRRRKDVWDLRNTNEKLKAELTSVNDNYAKDKAAAEERIQGLYRDLEIREEEYTTKIKALTAMNTEVKETMDRKVRVLNRQMTGQKKAFDQERKQLVQQQVQSERKLTDHIDDLNKALEAKVLQISSLKMALSEISNRFGEAAARADVLKKSRDEYVAELETKKKAVTELEKKLDAAERINTELAEKLDAAQKANAELVSKLDAGKNANAELAKKIDAGKETNAQLENKLEAQKEASAELEKKVDSLSRELVKHKSKPEMNN